jgi:CRP/FNR family cyclic AMP-dependent transcriptional regulator
MNNVFQELIARPDFGEGSAWQRIEADANEVVVREGEEGADIYLVLRGTVRIVGNLELEGNRHIHPGFYELGTGEVFGELALFDRGPRSASVIAVDRCVLARIPGDRLMAFLDAHPEVGYALLKELATVLVARIRRTDRKLLGVFAWGLQAHGIDEHL